MIEIYADGAYNSSLDQGGWAVVIVENGQKRVLSDSAKRTTSNRMELTAILEGLLSTPKGAEVIVYTDSQYLFGTMTRGWRRRVNRDLWQKLDEVITQRTVHWQWIQGGTKNPFHKEAHALATNLATQPPKPAPPSSAKAKMVDISPKPITQREAIAKAIVRMKPATLNAIKKGEIAKGDVITLAQMAGIMGAKKTAELIPLCHPLLIEDIQVEVLPDEKNNFIEIRAKVKGEGKTGMEMEALTAVAVSALTVYDMCKAIDPAISMEIRLVRKSGGKSGVVELEP